MGCSSSKRPRIVHRRSELPSLHRSRSAPGRAATRRKTGGAATAITSLVIEHGHLHLKEPTTDQAMEDEEELRRGTPENRRRSDLSLEVFPAKTWSAMVGRKLAGVPRAPTAPAAVLTPPAAEEKVAPEIVNAWQLMEGLEDSSSSSSSSGDTSSGRGTSPGSWAMERLMGRAASPECKSLPEVGSLGHLPGSSRLSGPPSPENETASPEKTTMVEEKIWEDAEVEMESAFFLEQPIWDLVEQWDDSLLSEFDGVISDFRKSLESFSEIEECMKIEQFKSENPIHEMASITSPQDDANLSGV